MKLEDKARRAAANAKRFCDEWYQTGIHPDESGQALQAMSLVVKQLAECVEELARRGDAEA